METTPTTTATQRRAGREFRLVQPSRNLGARSVRRPGKRRPGSGDGIEPSQPSGPASLIQTRHDAQPDAVIRPEEGAATPGRPIGGVHRPARPTFSESRLAAAHRRPPTPATDGGAGHGRPSTDSGNTMNARRMGHRLPARAVRTHRDEGDMSANTERWGDSEWHACASFAAIKVDLGMAVTDTETEALRRFPNGEGTPPPPIVRADGRKFSAWLEGR